MRSVALFLVIGLVLYPALNAGWDIAAVQIVYANPLPPPIGSICGNVTDAASGLPLEGAAIIAFADGSPWGWDTTDASGHYYIIELQIVPHDIEASMADYVTQTQLGVEVIADDTVRADFALVRNGSITCDYFKGDINGNGVANGIDISYGIAFFRGSAAPPDSCDCRPDVAAYPFYAAGDVNGDCVFNGVDIIWFVYWLKGIQDSNRFCPICPPE